MSDFGVEVNAVGVRGLSLSLGSLVHFPLWSWCLPPWVSCVLFSFLGFFFLLCGLLSWGVFVSGFLLVVGSSLLSPHLCLTLSCVG